MGCEGKSEIICHGIGCDKRGLGCKVYMCRLIFNTSNIFQINVYQTIVCLTHSTGAPNENIVQNHLNIALLNVF